MKSRIKKKMLHKEIDFSLIQVCGKKKKEGNYRKTVREKKAIDSKGHIIPYLEFQHHAALCSRYIRQY